ncbi:MAG: type II toxin-antitoxin system Y4mF family antitoxin [Bacteroidales bacterium]
MFEPDLLAEIVRKHRKMAGLSQLQLAEMAGVGKTVVYDIEKGKATIRLDTLRKILSVLNIRVQLTSPVMGKITGNEKS